MKIIILLAAVMVAVSCSPTLPMYEVKFAGNTIQVPTSNFESSTFNIIHDNTADYDILLIRRSPQAYDAYYLKCAYDGKALDPSTDLIVCPVCGSQYNFEGLATKAPADGPLTKFRTELNADQTLVTIEISSLGL